MKGRCYNPNNGSYRHYGGRGITVFDEWRSDFKAFLACMGPKPSRRHSIDRIDVDGNHEPGNVRWATPRQQAMNRRKKSEMPQFTASRVKLPSIDEALFLQNPYGLSEPRAR